MQTDMAKRIAGLVLFLVLWGVFAVETYQWLVPIQHNNDFLQRWYGAREMFKGHDPYAMELTDEVLIAHDLPLVDSRYFHYPATITWILLPFWVFPHDIAISLWCGLQLTLLSVLPLLMYQTLRWRMHPVRMLAVILLSIIGFQNALTVYTLGQFTIFVMACFLIAWWGVQRGSPAVAASALVGATIRAEGAVIVLVVLAGLLYYRHYRVVVWWLALMIVIFALTVLQIGFWVPDFWADVTEYDDVGVAEWLLDLFGSRVLGLALIAGVLAWCGWLLRATRHIDSVAERGLWQLSIVIGAVALTTPQTADYTLVYLLIPIWLLLWIGRDSLTTAIVFLWLPVVSYGAHFAYQRMDQSETGLLLNQFLTPTLVLLLLTYERVRRTRRVPDSVSRAAAV